MKKRDFFFEHIVQKEFIEDLMKAFGWVTLCGAIFTLSMATLKSGAWFSGLLIFALFLFMTVLTYTYVCRYVFIPLDDAMYPDDPYWKDRAESFTGTKRFIEIAKVTITRNKVIYLSLGLGFFFYAQAVATFLANKLNA